MDGNAEKDLTLFVVLLAGGMLAGPCFGAEEKGAEEEKEAEKGALKPGGALVVTPARKRYEQEADLPSADRARHTG
jgi:hypothetical protein